MRYLVDRTRLAGLPPAKDGTTESIEASVNKRGLLRVGVIGVAVVLGQ